MYPLITGRFRRFDIIFDLEDLDIMLDLQTIHQCIDIIPKYTGHPDADNIVQFLLGIIQINGVAFTAQLQEDAFRTFDTVCSRRPPLHSGS